MIEIYSCSGCKHWAPDCDCVYIGKCTNPKSELCGRWCVSDLACESYEEIDESIHAGD